MTLRQPSNNPPIASQTDNQGAFRLAAPAAGAYELEVQAAGFVPYKQQILLSVAWPVAQSDVTLIVAGGDQTVEVIANELTAETTSTQLGESLGA